VNGYKRYQPFMLAPDRIQWGRDNKGAMIRALIAPGDPAARVENRVAEPAANPYLFLAGQILAGLDGVSRGLSAPEPVERPYESEAEKLPASLGEALGRLRDQRLLAGMGRRHRPLARHDQAGGMGALPAHVSDWEEREYFGLF
jgi:glutamine synthetase